MTRGHAWRHALTTIGNCWPQGPAANSSNAACAASAGGGIDRAQRGRQRLALLPTRKLETVADEMHHAGLERRRRIRGLERFWHALEAIGDGDEDVRTPARLEVREDLQPELRAFGLLDPNPQDVARAVRQHRQGEIHGFAAHHGLIANLHAERVEEDDGIERSSGRACHSVTSATTASVTSLIRSGETSIA